ncbi:MAG: class I SAM-dependent methyltransferase [Alphaproteobacteria bacterium]|nr:class I SAM-dependent methyltransferase [Alphaproteobacteria bacterium]
MTGGPGQGGGAQRDLRLNIGCGGKPRTGWVNVDKFPSGQEDLVGDICAGLDLPDGCAREILLDNVIEHLDSIPDAMAELHRLLAPGGRLEILTPHYSSAASWRDPTHVSHLGFFSLDYFCSGHRANYTGDFRFEMAEKHLSFGGNLLGLIGRGLFALWPDKWEKRWAFMFRASTLRVVMTKPTASAEPTPG